jgi:hypothetical protein
MIVLSIQECICGAVEVFVLIVSGDYCISIISALVILKCFSIDSVASVENHLIVI